eukprot:jgi/Pico_ML_1/53516/g4051.t1
MCVRQGAASAVSEMVSAHTLLERTSKAMKLVSFDREESVRSVQLYGTQRDALKDAARMLVEEVGAAHVDLNFGCPVRKVTRKGGGAAVALKPKLLHSLVRSAVDGARGVPVTVKLRMGLSLETLTYVSAGMAAQDAGATGVTLHARTADQLYSSPVHWEAIAEMVHALSIPVIGNGDVKEPMDAVKMMHETGASGVMVGRGCLGRPWLFRQIADQMMGKAPQESKTDNVHPMPSPTTTEARGAIADELGGKAGRLVWMFATFSFSMQSTISNSETRTATTFSNSTTLPWVR